MDNNFYKKIYNIIFQYCILLPFFYYTTSSVYNEYQNTVDKTVINYLKLFISYLLIQICFTNVLLGIIYRHSYYIK